MTCKAWLEGSCDCDQPCDSGGSFSSSYSVPKPIAPVISAFGLSEIKHEFKVLAEVYVKDYPTHIVWEHFQLVAKLLDVELGD